MKRLLFVCALIAAMSTPAFAFVHTGNKYLSDKEKDKMGAIMYVTGMFESVGFWTDINIPANVTMGQAQAIFEKYLADNPAERHEPAYFLFLKSLKESYGIKKKD